MRTPGWKPTVDPIMEMFLFSWESQVRQYPVDGPPGISYFKGDVDATRWVDCLLYRDKSGLLVGILNHYPFDMPPWEQQGNVNVWVHPDHQRQGIGTALVLDAVEQWRINLEQQRYTTAGAALAIALYEKAGSHGA